MIVCSSSSLVDSFFDSVLFCVVISCNLIRCLRREGRVPRLCKFLCIYVFMFCIWAASSEKGPSNMRKMYRFRSSCAGAKSHPGLCSLVLHSVVMILLADREGPDQTARMRERHAFTRRSTFVQHRRGSRMMSVGVCFDKITVLTLCIQTDRP